MKNTRDTEMSNSKVSNTIRNANKHAIESRAKWRNEYAWLTRQIQKYKRLVAYDSRVEFHLINPEFCKEASYCLKSLKIKANDMMHDRYGIKMNLIKTAYKYV